MRFCPDLTRVSCGFSISTAWLRRPLAWDVERAAAGGASGSGSVAASGQQVEEVLLLGVRHVVDLHLGSLDDDGLTPNRLEPLDHVGERPAAVLAFAIRWNK